MWEYRVVRKTVNNTETYTIREVYYNKDGEICAISQEGIAPYGETPAEIASDLSYMSRALTKDPLIEEEIKFAKPDWGDHVR